MIDYRNSVLVDRDVVFDVDGKFQWLYNEDLFMEYLQNNFASIDQIKFVIVNSYADEDEVKFCLKNNGSLDLNELHLDDDYLNDPEGSHVFDAFIYNYGKELMQKYPQDMLRCVNGFYWNSVTATQGERVDDDPYEALISMWNKLTKENKQAVGQVLLDHLDEDDCPDLFEHVNEKVKLVQEQQEVNKQGRGR